MRLRWLAGTLAFALVTQVEAPHAYAEQPSVSATQRAKSHFKRGRDLQRARVYDDAIVEYLEAYRLAPRPELLFNVAQCYRLAGVPTQAIEYYLRFLIEVPDGAAADEARAHIAELRRPLGQPGGATPAAPRPPPVSPPPAAEVATAPVETHHVEEVWPRPVTAPSVDADEVDASIPAVRLDPARSVGDPAGSRPLRWLGVTGVVSGVTLIGAGVYFGWRAHNTANLLEDVVGPWPPELVEREQEAKQDEERMLYLISGGGALMVVSATLWWWSGKSGAVRAQPSLGRSQAGMLVYGSF
jgi:tetratricopeptide (TPR) repeat protein